MRVRSARWGVPIYYGALALITARQTVFGNSDGLWIAHAFGGLVVLSAIIRGELVREVINALRPWHSWMIIAFLFYLFFQATTHPIVGETYLRQLARDIIVPMAFGAVLFSSAPTSRALDAIGLFFGATLLVLTAATIAPALRSDVFLVATQEGAPLYQAFGIQIGLAAAASAVIFSTYWGFWAGKGYVAWLLFIPALFTACGLLCQAMGSNSGTVYLLGCALSLGVSALWRVRKNALAILFLAFFGLSAAFGTLFILSSLPAMRITQYQPVSGDDSGETISFFHNIETRIKLWVDEGAPQFARDPLFGDLAADILVTGKNGNYIHSIASIQTHLGVIGSLIFISFLSPALFALFVRARRHTALTHLAFPTLALSMLSFFTWQPLWFFVGALFIMPGWQRRPVSASTLP